MSNNIPRQNDFCTQQSLSANKDEDAKDTGYPTTYNGRTTTEQHSASTFCTLQTVSANRDEKVEDAG